MPEPKLCDHISGTPFPPAPRWAEKAVLIVVAAVIGAVIGWRLGR